MNKLYLPIDYWDSYLIRINVEQLTWVKHSNWIYNECRRWNYETNKLMIKWWKADETKIK